MGSFSNKIYGYFGAEKVTSPAKIGGLPLGCRMELLDGRLFAHAKMSATAGVAGNLYRQNALGVVAGTADADMLVNMAPADAAIGAKTVTVTLSATAGVSKDLLEDGYLFVAEGTGAGHTYKIKSHPAAVKSTTCAFSLYDNDAVKVALASGTSKVGLRQNEFHNLLLNTANTVSTGPLAGILPVAAPANYYCWVQRRGPVAAFTDNTTLIVGNPVTASSTVAGQVAVLNITAADTAGTGVRKGNDPIGYCMNVAASAKYSLINLTLE